MEAVFKFWKQGSGEGIFEAGFENITDVEAIQTIDIEFNNTGNFIPAFIYSQEELDQIQANNAAYEEAMAVKKETKSRQYVPQPKLIIPEFPKTGKYFSPRLLEELQKFTNLKEINIIASGNAVEMDDSFDGIAANCQVNIVSGTSDSTVKSAVRAVAPVISTPAELFALMQSTNTEEMFGNYTLANDIDMTGFVCESIGREPTNFGGTFDGQGYTIRIADVSSTVFGGLFGLVVGGTIQNINVVYTNPNLTINGIAVGPFLYSGGLVANPNLSITISNCNVVYEGDVIINGDVNGGFGNLYGFSGENPVCNNCSLTTKGVMTFNAMSDVGGAFGSIQQSILTNFTYTAENDISMATANGSSGGLIGYVPNCEINNIVCNIKNITFESQYDCGGFTAGISSSTTVDNITFNAENITINAPLSWSGGFIGYTYNLSEINDVKFTIGDLTVTDADRAAVYNGSNNSSVEDNITGTVNNVIITTTNGAGGICGIAAVPSGTTSQLNNINCVILGTAEFNSVYCGGIVGGVGTAAPKITTVSNCNCIFNKSAVFNGVSGTTFAGGMVGGIPGSGQINVSNSSVFYGTNTEFNATNIGGIAAVNKGSHTNSIVVYNNYTFTGTTVEATFASGTGTETNCFVNTFSTDTLVIPNTNTVNVLAALADEPTTAWLSGLLKIRQNLDVSNNSQSLSSIFTSSPATSNTAKNNALNASMAFAGVAYINTTPSIIQPLLVKYSSILPSNIRYAVPDENNEIDVSDATSYYIYQNPAYIVPANKTILSSTEGDGSVAFDTEVVPVGSKTTINDVVYNVVGVGSSLIEVVKGGNETTSSNSLSIAFAIIAGVILLLVVVFTYLYGWRGYMFLPVIIALVLAVLAIVYAF